ncbi:sulfite exporter TauE/SafE family protein [Leptospirillum ferriphilum]|uniref:Probable membrane transporter protein n=2 Tax=Leptospirillum ferriphilum TaxID=178606 RepID=A0A059XTD2_9BACT|nr:sulfite exporter TauE/SafE family protein [Leptospirillum ferriphilum]AFS54056.1 putative permease [Leptospirillum ferriphilum ML-04]AIA31869.1 hypothetical protein Y981_09270 [Leptospirillum ferriphilum YSK]
MNDFLFLLGGGALAGLVSGLLGIGGAVILIPYVLYVVPSFLSRTFTPFEATQISMFQVFFASVAGYVTHRPQLLLPVKTLLAWGGAALLGSAIGGTLSGHLPGKEILVLYLAEILLALLLLHRKPRPAEQTPDRLEWRRTFGAPVLMGGIGLVSGLLGIGGGFLYYPVMTGLLGYSARVAVGSSLGIMIPMAFSGMIAKTLSSGSFPDGTFPVAIGALAGSIVGARLHRRLTPAKIRWGQTLLLVATFARILASLL